jgi:hypothetical protein
MVTPARSAVRPRHRGRTSVISPHAGPQRRCHTWARAAKSNDNALGRDVRHRMSVCRRDAFSERSAFRHEIESHRHRRTGRSDWRRCDRERHRPCTIILPRRRSRARSTTGRALRRGPDRPASPAADECSTTRAIVPARTRFHVRTRLCAQPPAVSVCAACRRTARVSRRQ